MSDSHCTFAVTRDWELEPCDQPATCIIRYEWDGGTFTDPACTYHAHMHGKGAALPITDHIAHLIIESDRIRNEPAGDHAPTPDPLPTTNPYLAADGAIRASLRGSDGA